MLLLILEKIKGERRRIERREQLQVSSILGLVFGLSFALALSFGLINRGDIAFTAFSSFSAKNNHSYDQQQSTPEKRRLEESTSNNANKQKAPLKILYTITSLAEYNSGSRATTKGSDRLQETLIPVVSEGVHSMLAAGFDVDVFLVAHYTLQPDRLQLIRDGLPAGVGKLNYWDDAMPLGYDTGNMHNHSQLGERSVSLARQHRFVVRDHLMEYDLFACFEDDMLITGTQVEHYVTMSNEIERLKEAAPEDLPGKPNGNFYGKTFHGPMTKGQLSRMIPGFIRVEVLLDPAATPTKGHTRISPVPIDMNFGRSGSAIDPAACCHVGEERASPKRPSNPTAEQLILWETDIHALGVRQLPQQQDDDNESSLLDWAGLMRGPTYSAENEPNTIIGDYWAGNDGYYKDDLKLKRRPNGNDRKMINNMGGWMATRQQIWTWHTEICLGGFLPPYASPHYRFDGLDLRDVEWWSGGLQLATKRHACNMQRIISLKSPEDFSKHLIYHSANNKQKQLGLGRFTTAQDLLGQLNTVRKHAEAAMQKEKQ